jgi:hypothetical protein
LFHTNGTLLTTITNPTPGGAEMFGYRVAAIGDDRMVVTALFDDLAGENAGAAYLFHIDGGLLATFANPFPTANSQFGSSVAIVDNESVLIGALDGPLIGTFTGAVYQFNTNGVLQHTFTNPLTPHFSNQYTGFGSALAALGIDHVVVGAPNEDPGAMDAGAAYLFRIPPPALGIGLRSASTVVVSWPSPSGRYTPQESTGDLAAPRWSSVDKEIQDDGTNKVFVVQPSAVGAVYRLSRP